MERSSIMRTSLTLLALLGFGIGGIAYAQSSSTSTPGTGGASKEAGKERDGGHGMKDGPTRDGTEKSLGTSAPGSSGSGAASGSGGGTPPQGSALGGSTGDKGFSNVRENKGGKGALGTMGGSTDTKAGHAGESIGSGGTGKSDESGLDASAPADGSSTGIAK